MEKKYTLLVRGKRVEVSSEVYKAYYKAYERERYTADVASDMERSLERFNEDGISVEYQYAMSRPSLEDQILHEQMKEKLTTALNTLDTYERMLIKELVINGKSERKLASECGIPSMTIHDHKHKIMNKLKTLIEK
jgi:RNA polymerase sigma factor (sigma-70 family)